MNSLKENPEPYPGKYVQSKTFNSDFGTRLILISFKYLDSLIRNGAFADIHKAPSLLRLLLEYSG